MARHARSAVQWLYLAKTIKAINETENLSGLQFNQELRKTIWLCLSYALFVTQETEILNELEQIIDYVSGKARLLAEECIALLTLHVAPHPLPLLHPLLSCAFNTLAGRTILSRALSLHMDDQRPPVLRVSLTS
jgi:hypothetical protein